MKTALKVVALVLLGLAVLFGLTWWGSQAPGEVSCVGSIVVGVLGGFLIGWAAKAYRVDRQMEKRTFIREDFRDKRGA